MIGQNKTPIYPLATQQENGQLEREWNEIFRAVFEKTLQKKTQEISVYGLPWASGTEESIYPFFSLIGLNTLQTIHDIDKLSFLYKAWTVTNPKRGFHFLRTFLQMVYPEAFTIYQLWQPKSETYPNGLVSESNATQETHWLTSRVRLEVEDWSEGSSQLLNKYRPVLQSIVSARFVLDLGIIRPFKGGMKIGAAIGAGARNLVCFEGTLKINHTEGAEQ